ncbi:uncharacterized protein LOC128216776 [Mya arenaria]|uniref:uncharacterized protein LOC128216776 n=1 Tax=Mya arenaria TaxID=6604 RepID=UPI0022E113D6|nr:uncharacterized protein LOC128216776 [Mya arenaria]
MFSKKPWSRTKRNKRENSFRRKDVLLSKENLYWDDMHKREYRDSEFSCNHVNPTVEDEDTVWKVRGCQGESSQYLEPLCQAMIMKETVICGPEIKVRPLPPLPQATPTSSIYNYVDKEFWSDEHRDSNERNHYEERLQFFKEMIISNVDVRQVLPHLTFVEYPQKYRNIADRSKRDAMILLVNEIEKSEELGRWKQFVEALERCGYEYISRCLKGHSVIDNSYQKKFLEIMSVTVRKQIVPTELTAYLWNADVINDEDKQRIECQQTLQGEIAAADLLLEILPTKNDNWYKLFIDALRHAEMIDVANLLDLPELREGKKVPKIISTRTDAEYSPANSMQEVTERIKFKTIPDSDNTVFKSTSLDDVNEQNTNMNYQNKDSSNMDTMENETCTWSSWSSTKSVPEIPFFVVALHSRPKKREMELSISEGDCLKVVEDYGDFYGVQVEGRTWLIPRDSAKVFDKVPIPLPRECAESADETYSPPPPLPERNSPSIPERNSPSLPERTPVDAFKINDTTEAATYSDDKRYEEVESHHLRAKVFDTVPTPLPGEWAESADETYKVPPPLRERAPVDALKLNDTTVAATDCIDKRYEEVESPDLRDTVDEEVCTQGSLNELLDCPPFVNAFKKTEDSRENNVRNAKCTRQLSSFHLLKDSSTLDDVIDADWKTLKEEQDRLFKAERLVKEELERLKALVNIKNNINELQCQKLKVAKDFASAGERFKLHRESIKGVQGGNFDHFEPESEYSSEGLYSAQHMLRNRTEKTSRDLPLQFEMYRARSTGRKSWRSRASSFKDSAIYECTNLAAVEEDT